MSDIRALQLGVRVVVRHRLDDGRATDSLGELVALSRTTATVKTKRGLDEVAIADVIAWRQVPPPPKSR